jgi:hypothetical protein
VLLDKYLPKLDRSPTGTGREWTIDFEFIFRSAGHNWLPFFKPGSDGPPVIPPVIRVDFASVDKVFCTAATLPDDRSLHNARDFNNLLDPNP